MDKQSARHGLNFKQTDTTTHAHAAEAGRMGTHINQRLELNISFGLDVLTGSLFSRLLRLLAIVSHLATGTPPCVRCRFEQTLGRLIAACDAVLECPYAS